MFFVLSKILDLALAPVTWCLVLMIAGFLRPRWQRSCFAAALVSLWCASVLPVAARLQSAVETSWPLPPPSEHFDAIVLLGGVVSVVEDDGTPGFNDNVERLHQSFEMLRAGIAKEVVITGDFGGSPPSEAEMLRDKLVLWGIAPERIVLEPRARNTRENALFTAPILRERGYGQVGLVTSRFHMRRSVACFRAVGVDVIPVPVDGRVTVQSDSWLNWLMPRSHFLDMSTAALREWAGYWVYRARGYAS